MFFFESSSPETQNISSANGSCSVRTGTATKIEVQCQQWVCTEWPYNRNSLNRSALRSLRRHRIYANNTWVYGHNRPYTVWRTIWVGWPKLCSWRIFCAVVVNAMHFYLANFYYMVTQCTLTVDIALQSWLQCLCGHYNYRSLKRYSASLAMTTQKKNICHIFCDRQTCAELDDWLALDQSLGLLFASNRLRLSSTLQS